MPVVFLLLMTIPAAAITGGIASAIAGGGTEDKTIVENWAIGFLGWILALMIWSAATRDADASLGTALLALVVSIGLAKIDDRRTRDKSLTS